MNSDTKKGDYDEIDKQQRKGKKLGDRHKETHTDFRKNGGKKNGGMSGKDPR